MNLYAPKYYSKFHCIADKCKHSCCIGWEIDIDENTLNKYKTSTYAYANTVLHSIDFSGVSHFRLADKERCPHLDKNGLCCIIKSMDEEYLCDICREHPRFYNYSNRGKEVGLGMACEEACRIILSSEDFDEFYVVNQLDEDIVACEFDACAESLRVYKILKDNSLSFTEKVELISDFYDIKINATGMSELLNSLEYLYSQDKHLICSVNDIGEIRLCNDVRLPRILAYYIYRHCFGNASYEEFCSSLSFSIFCTMLIAKLSENNDMVEISRIVSEEIEYSEDNTEAILSYFDNDQVLN